MWSPKQNLVFDTIIDGGADTIIIPGPTQSGKSISGVYAFAALASRTAGQEFIIGSHTQRQLEASVLKHMRDAARFVASGTGLPCEFRREGEHYIMDSACPWVPNPAPNIFYPVLGSNAGAEGRARSFAVAGALIDEGTLWHEAALNQIIARCSSPGAVFVTLTNPSGPLHPLKVKLIDPYDPEYGGTHHPAYAHIPFELDDNPSLTDRYKERLAASFVGAEYDRMVLGRWAAMQGAIYPFLHEALAEPPPGFVPKYYTASGDYGGYNPTVIGLWAHYEVAGVKVTWLVREWIKPGGQTMRVDEQARRIKRELLGGLAAPLRRVTIDGTATELIVALKKVGLPVMPAENNPGTLYQSIQLTRARLESGRIRISRARCPYTVGSLSNYIWDPNSITDQPLKRDDHGADMVRYEAWAEGGEQARRTQRRPQRVGR